jgi:vacuolar protein sorting-associated protein 45
LQTRDSVKSIEDMRALIEKMPELRRKGANLEKHVTVMAELNRRIESQKMFEVSELEQSLADTESLAKHFEQVGSAIEDPGIRPFDALRLVMLFALRYEADGGARVAELKVALEGKGLKAGDIALIDALLEYGGIRARGGDLFSKKTIAARMLRTVSRSVKGVESMLAQHTPQLEQVLTEVGKGVLSPTLYPYAGKAEASPRVSTVIVFIVGGMTFEEAVSVNKINTTGSFGMNVILGGTAVQNSQSFIADLRRLAQDAASGVTRGASAAAPAAASASSVAVEVGGLVLSPSRGSSSYGTLS